MALALGVAHPALGQPISQLPCNALCRAYMGSHYTPPGEPAAEPLDTASMPVFDEGSTFVPMPPRRTVQTGVPTARRFAVLPPPRPGITGDRRDPETAGSGVVEPIAEPVTMPITLPLPSPAMPRAEPASSSIAPEPVGIAPEPVGLSPEPVGAVPAPMSDVPPPTTEPPAAVLVTESIAGPAETSSTVVVPSVVAVPAPVPPVLAAVPEPRPRQRSLLR